MVFTSSFKIYPSSNLISDKDRKLILQNPGFGKVFSDHMAIIHWSEEKGWYNANISERRKFSLDPATSILHYAQGIFEGLKAYSNKDGKIFLFRIEQNAKRFACSALRLDMPVLPEEMFCEAIIELIKIDKLWIPKREEDSLYIRPFMFASEAFLGVRSSKEYIFCVIASPTRSYFKNTNKPITVWIEKHLSRSSPGGTGSVKCGGNYAASLQAQTLSYKKGCDQVVFLDSIEHNYIEELGGMNIFFVLKNNKLITPSLNGTILPGITRSSIISLSQEFGFKIEERNYSFEEWKKDAREGILKEVFSCGTAAVISSIGKVIYDDGSFSIGDEKEGKITKNIKKRLFDIQRGYAHDPYGWVKILNI